MEKKKLGLSGKSKLELSKTVGSGTVKQSFSHGRVKSVAVEVKRIRTFRKNNDDNNLVNEDTLQNSQLDNANVDYEQEEKNNTVPINKETDEINKDKLKKLKENAQSERIARENKISSTEKVNQKENPAEKKSNLLKSKEVVKKDGLKAGDNEEAKKNRQEKNEEAPKKTCCKKKRAA